MRRVAALVAVVGLGLWVWWLVGRGDAPAPEPSRAEPAAGASARVASGDAPSSEPIARADATRPRRDRAERDVMHRRILDAMHARERAARDRASAATDEDASSRRAAPVEAEDEPAVGGLVDRTGNHEYHVKVMNEDLMPLVDECFELAKEEDPELSGMLMVELSILGEEEIGGVVDVAQPSPRNEVHSPALLECVTESILATTLPPPPEGGRDEIMLSMPLSPDDDR